MTKLRGRIGERHGERTKVNLTFFKLGCSIAALALSNGLMATETTTYTYDAQGRLVQSGTSGTVNNGQSTATTFDTAGNRTNYSVSTGAPPPPPPPSTPITLTDGGLAVLPAYSANYYCFVSPPQEGCIVTGSGANVYNHVTGGQEIFAPGYSRNFYGELIVESAYFGTP